LASVLLAPVQTSSCVNTEAMFDFTVSSLFVLSDGLLFAMAQCVKAADLFPEVPGAKRRKKQISLLVLLLQLGGHHWM
jgi:hypothetical protein